MVDFATRVMHLEEEGAYAMLARAQALEAAGRQIIHLEIGQPDYPTYPHISLAGIKAISNGQTRYNPPAGLLALRAAIASEAGKRRNVPLSASNVVIGPGAKPGLFFPTLALVSPGDEVIYPDPGFPTYAAMIGVAGGKPMPVPLREENNFSFDLEVFDRLINPHTRLIVLNSPANPTGGVIPLADLEHIAEQALKYNCWVLSDEIYARFAYDGCPAPSILSLPGMLERTVVVDGFSKTYAMTGWRLGYAILPETLAQRVELLLTHSVGCTATFTQVAGLQALEGSQEMVDHMVEIYQQRRDLLVKGLNDIPGVTCMSPQGAFYVFPNVSSFGMGSRQVASFLLEEAGVAVLAGVDFGQGGEGYLRLCYAASEDTLRQALEQMSAAFARLHR